MRVLLVEDDADAQALVRACLVRIGDMTVDSVSDGAAAIEALRAASYDAVILDLMLPKANGFEVAASVQTIVPRPQLIVLSALSRYHGDRFPTGTIILQKPFEIDEVTQIIEGLQPAAT